MRVKGFPNPGLVPLGILVVVSIITVSFSRGLAAQKNQFYLDTLPLKRTEP
jgi:hypothetical protein